LLVSTSLGFALLWAFTIIFLIIFTIVTFVLFLGGLEGFNTFSDLLLSVFWEGLESLGECILTSSFDGFLNSLKIGLIDVKSLKLSFDDLGKLFSLLGVHVFEGSLGFTGEFSEVTTFWALGFFSLNFFVSLLGEFEVFFLFIIISSLLLVLLFSFLLLSLLFAAFDSLKDIIEEIVLIISVGTVLSANGSEMLNGITEGGSLFSSGNELFSELHDFILIH